MTYYVVIATYYVIIMTYEFFKKQKMTILSCNYDNLIKVYPILVIVKGVAIILTNNLTEYSMIDKQTDEEGRILLLNIKLLFNNKIYTLINVYAPNDAQHRITLLKKINKFIAKSDKNIIICVNLQ